MKETESQPIICGTDFSENSRRAADTAAILATMVKAPLVLAHAKSPLVAGSTPEANNAVCASLRERLHKEAQRLRTLGAAVAERLDAGAPDEVLVHAAQEQHARLLVVSSHGQSAAARWFIGSVAERTAESSPIPTLVVREAAPFEAWGRGAKPLKIFVGVDFTASSDAALRWIAALRGIGPCEVVAAYVDWPPEERNRVGVFGPLGMIQNQPQIQEVLERDLMEKVSGIVGKEKVSIVVQSGWGRADSHLVELAKEAGADILVVGTHQWHGLSRLRHGSISRGILHHAPMSVACVPPAVGGAMAGPRIRECRRVLACVDLGSSHGFAAPYAYAIINSGGAVRLLHILGPAFSGGDDRQRFEEAETRLRALAPPKAEARGIETDLEVLEDFDTARAICAAAERFNADVVCIGSHTRPGFTAKIMGSIALGVLTQCRRPVLIVWPPAE